ncbi:ATP-dependent helicase HrpB [Zhongshania aliphaticivorans]|uniref:ATP-dependent helicase HrpB n=1 Tax=Zhongshania aliphaticivorans TaxID=1470434 RepID=UPI0012E549D2|nr:ATP-dependent helicase HrpB [Zhongshania aliphaticivorans]CAA0093141.1 ATP-dependent RNA helicase SrmB [Zhongshania aliphaticivorans]
MADLPIQSVIPDIRSALTEGNELVLEAPPGAGKTTWVPLALLRESWLENQRIVMLEPRRIAAKSAAERMAELLGERVGLTVGYRMRMETVVSHVTRIEVITEGILTRMLQDDPSLDGIGLLIFDEFHERSLDADLGLALTLESRNLFGDLRNTPLKLLLMSATLDGSRVSELLDGAPVVRSLGRQFPVEIRYGEAYRPNQFLIDRVCGTVRQAIEENSGSILVFLPGQAEIRRCLTKLSAEHSSESVIFAPLYGDLSLTEQRRAIAPTDSGVRKVVLATSIAESSLTIDGISVVVDCGLSRVPSFDPRTGMSRLDTRRLSRASADQRAGRAGRLSEGVCYRLWSEAQNNELLAFSEPEIAQADLASLCLQILRWGIDDAAKLRWMDPPPAAAFQQAVDLLLKLGAVTKVNGLVNITAHGEAMAGLPVHPRLAHMLLKGQALASGALASELAAILSERSFGPKDNADIQLRLAMMRGEFHVDRQSQGLVARLKKQQQQFLRLLSKHAAQGKTTVELDVDAGVLLAFAYPDRIAKQRRERSSDYVLSNGRAASLQMADGLNYSPYLVAAALGGVAGNRSDSIYLAAALDSRHFEGALADMVTTQSYAEWDEAKGRFIAERRHTLGALVLKSETLRDASADEKRTALLDFVCRRGLGVLDWSDGVLQWRARVSLLGCLDCEPGHWPDVSDEGLLAGLDTWLSPYLDGVNSLQGIKRLDLSRILASLLDWPQQQALNSLAPESFIVPSGSAKKIDYCQSPPVLAVKLQEMFGCQDTPNIANGKQPLTVHLLSPARRPLQVTQDLAGFWRGSYQDVKKEMKGRYPKHPWPDDPTTAVATARLKPKPT